VHLQQQLYMLFLKYFKIYLATLLFVRHLWLYNLFQNSYHERVMWSKTVICLLSLKFIWAPNVKGFILQELEKKLPELTASFLLNFA
jgi:hypothetical protein